ncbi:hypothetical protein NDU88_003949 [Pleurodeles waltl]|uniref:UPAR/Ly6 domain-containing protein n=1 Tax=Pleurodeles waltl TaxID=8319 RepID=A0AAV7V3W3_PLEWA|nr:hypothetical protein NDU88_003949 [Pleurodeles waltl]
MRERQNLEREKERSALRHEEKKCINLLQCTMTSVQNHTPKMKLSLILLLAAGLYVQLGDALHCYYCPMPMSAAECMEIKNCSSQFQWCQTKLYAFEVVYPYPPDGYVVKNCVKDCKPSQHSIGEEHPISCCNYDLCNQAGINGTRDDANSKDISYVLLTASAGLISVLHQTGL